MLLKVCQLAKNLTSIVRGGVQATADYTKYHEVTAETELKTYFPAENSKNTIFKLKIHSRYKKTGFIADIKHPPYTRFTVHYPPLCARILCNDDSGELSTADYTKYHEVTAETELKTYFPAENSKNTIFKLKIHSRYKKTGFIADIKHPPYTRFTVHYPPLCARILCNDDSGELCGIGTWT
ncbi:hypothetical protein AWZ03_004332 [Drosophila navojoa]|uniref:Uncharacterized protein n=1 Tax=Drosophila navojoa TaxID=7232 RepID=A0A484BKD0_DRONA|nr:hypothetical protein AWZ03_004332 [Drosophila navojoa]